MAYLPSLELNTLPKLPSLGLKELPTLDLKNLPSLGTYQTTESSISDYSDTKELNSFVDAVSNSAAIQKAAKDWGVLEWTKDIPGLRNIVAAGDVAYNKGIKPVLQGDWRAAGVNTLINLGETLDVVANPIKGLLLEGPEGFVKATGLGSTGRTNYDFDTGSWLVDIGLELIVDPLNWMSLGGKAAISGAAKTVTKEVISEAAEKATKTLAKKAAKLAGRELTEEVAQKAIIQVAENATKVTSHTLVDLVTGTIKDTATKEVTKLAKHGIKKTVTEVTEELITKQSLQLKNSILKKLLKSLPSDMSEALIKEKTILAQFIDTLDSLIKDLKWDTMANQINKSLTTIYKTSERFDRFLLRSSFATSGLGLGWKAAKPVLKAGSQFINNTVIRNLRRTKLISANNVIDIFKYDAAKQVYTESAKMARILDDVVVVRNPETFYRLIQNQFNVDKNTLQAIMIRSNGDIGTQARALEKYIALRYKGFTLKEYIDNIIKINAQENGAYNQYVNYLEYITQHIKNAPMQILQNGTKKPRTIKSLYSMDIITKNQKNVKDTNAFVTKLVKEKTLTSKDGKFIRYMADQTYYQIKSNELYTQLNLVNTEGLPELLQNISNATDNTLGKILDNIIQDPKAYTKNSQLLARANNLKNTAKNTELFEHFCNDILNTTYPNIKGVTNKSFQNHFLDILYSFGNKTAQDVMTEIDIIIPELIAKMEIVLHVPLNSMTDILKTQVYAFASQVALNNTSALLFYTIDKNFVSDLIYIKRWLKKIGYQTNDIEDVIKNMYKAYEDIELNNQLGKVWNETLMDVNKSILLDNSSTSVLSTLYAGLDGEYAYGVRSLFTTKGLSTYFNFTEDAFYSNTVLEQASSFVKDVNYKLAKLKPQYTSEFFTIQEEEINNLYTFLKANILDLGPTVCPADLQYILFLNKEGLDVAHKFAMLETFYSKALSNKDQVYLQRIFALYKKQNSKSYRQLYNLLANPKQLEQTTVLFNPQMILASAENTVFHEDFVKNINTYNALTQNPDKIIGNLNNFTEALRKTQDETSPLLHTSERYLKLSNEINENLLRYTEAKMKSLWDQDIADYNLKTIREQFNVPEDYLNLLERFYTEDILTDAEYSSLLTQSKKYLRVEPKITPVNIIKNIPTSTPTSAPKYTQTLVPTPKYMTYYDQDLSRRFRKDKIDLYNNSVLSSKKLKTMQDEIKLKEDQALTKYYNVPYSSNKETINALYKKYSIQLSAEIKQGYWNSDIFHSITKDVIEAYKEMICLEEQLDYMRIHIQKYTNNKALLQKIDNYIKEVKTKKFVDMDEQVSYFHSAVYSLDEQVKKSPIKKSYTKKLVDPIQTKQVTTKVLEHVEPEKPNIDIQAPFAKQKEFHQALVTATDQHNKASLVNFLTLSPEEMQIELAFRKRIVTFNINDWSNDKNMQSIYTDLQKYRTEKLNALGINLHVDPDTGNAILYLNKNINLNALDGKYYLNGREIIRKIRKLDYAEFKNVDPKIYDSLNKYDSYLEELTGHSVNTSSGDIMDEALFDTIYNGFSEEAIAEQTTKATEFGQTPVNYHLGLPKEVKNNLPEFELMKNNAFFNQYLFNESVLGSTRTRKQIQVYTSNTMIKTARSSLEQVGVHIQPKLEYVSGILNSQFSISNGIYKNFTDEQILETLVKEPGYRLVALKENTKQGMKVIEIPALNKEAIVEGRRLGATIVPTSVFTQMVNVVNHRLGGSGFLKLWNRVMYTYKFGYLFNIGTISRNYIDTNIKTDLELGPEARGFKKQSRSLILNYKDINKQISKMSTKGAITQKGITEYFETFTDTKMTKETYDLLDDFFNYGPVTNIAKDTASLTDKGGNIWRSFTNVSGNLMNWANQTEETNRLAMYLADLDKGVYKHDAWQHIARVHFDYDYKTPTEQLIEMVLPFSTFAIRNTQYWVDTLLAHPEYLSLFRDMYTPIWNFDDLTPEQLDTSWALQQQIINGHIDLFDTEDKSYIARFNPSIFDAVGIMIDPIDAVRNKIATPIQDMAELLQGESTPSVDMLPIVGALTTKAEKGVKEQNILPSLITSRTQNTQSSWSDSSSNYYDNNKMYGVDKTYTRPNIRSDARIDPYRTVGQAAYRSRFLPSQPQADLESFATPLRSARSMLKRPGSNLRKPEYQLMPAVYAGVRYQLSLDVNKFR